MEKLMTLVVSAVATWFLGGTNPSVLSTNTGESRPQDSFVWFLVDRPDNLILIPNYEQKADFRQVVVENSCEKAINGGFYDTDHRALGLVVAGGNEIFANRPNKLFDGYVYRNEETVGISRIKPESALFALQTGPLLVEGKKVRTLAIKNDTNSRRSVAILTDQNELIFGMFYDPQSPLDGPKLSDLPKLVLEQADKMDVGIVAAINLDGGSASSFFDGGFAVSEWSPVGSVWCLK